MRDRSLFWTLVSLLSSRRPRKVRLKTSLKIKHGRASLHNRARICSNACTSDVYPMSVAETTEQFNRNVLLSLRFFLPSLQTLSRSSPTRLPERQSIHQLFGLLAILAATPIREIHRLPGCASDFGLASARELQERDCQERCGEICAFKGVYYVDVWACTGNRASGSGERRTENEPGH